MQTGLHMVQCGYVILPLPFHWIISSRYSSLFNVGDSNYSTLKQTMLVLISRLLGSQSEKMLVVFQAYSFISETRIHEVLCFRDIINRASATSSCLSMRVKRLLLKLGLGHHHSGFTGQALRRASITRTTVGIFDELLYTVHSRKRPQWSYGQRETDDIGRGMHKNN